jgi:hypothetical protein
MSVRKSVGNETSNQPVQDTNLVDALDALPSVLKVPSLDTWKAVLREGLNWTVRPKRAPKRETRVGEIKQRYQEGDHPRTMLTLPREITREGMRAEIGPLYHNKEMDEAEPDMEKIESRTTDVLQEEGEPGEAGRSHNPHNQSPSPSPPIPDSREADMQPEHLQIAPTTNPWVLKQGLDPEEIFKILYECKLWQILRLST